MIVFLVIIPIFNNVRQYYPKNIDFSNSSKFVRLAKLLCVF